MKEKSLYSRKFRSMPNHCPLLICNAYFMLNVSIMSTFMELAAESPRNDIISNGDVVFEYPMSARVEMVLASLGGGQGCLARPLGKCRPQSLPRVHGCA